MKWPATLTFIRHGESAYNELKKKKKGNGAYDAFTALFDRDFGSAKDDRWVTPELEASARALWGELRLTMSDYDTPLTELGKRQAEETGKGLKAKGLLPDVIYVSPYLRTRETLSGLIAGWPELKGVKSIVEERIREQEHGISTVFNDWRIFYALNPLQGLLYKLEGEYAYRYPNGENKADVRDRVRSFLSTLIREDAGRHILVVSHHLTLLSLRANLERWSREQFIETDLNEKPINCGVTTYRVNPSLGKEGKLVLAEYNAKLY